MEFRDYQSVQSGTSVAAFNSSIPEFEIPQFIQFKAEAI
jgi:hypothetical protein